jgi:peptidoglycan hydrolase-like protein with peptidoglycan-binding domain
VGRRRSCHAVLRAIACLAVLGLVAAAGCDKGAAERRARQAAEKMKESLPDVDGKALAQKLPAEEVRQLQQKLTVLKEYQGEITGDLDSVTVNALEAFQREQGIKDDGLLTERTKRLLAEAVDKAQRQPGER